MALSTLTLTIPVTWTSIGPLAAEEMWQCREGVLLVTLENPTSDAQGQLLHFKDTLNIPQGKTVRVRALTTAAQLNREVL